jgi:hypothetical protein
VVIVFFSSGFFLLPSFCRAPCAVRRVPSFYCLLSPVFLSVFFPFTLGILASGL